MRPRHIHQIDARLTAYASSTRAALSRKGPGTQAKRWIAYGAAAGAALTMAPAAEALPIYSGLQDILLTPGNTVGLDLDGNGVSDVTASNFAIQYGFGFPRLFVPYSNAVLGVLRPIGSSDAANLPMGYAIGVSSPSRFFFLHDIYGLAAANLRLVYRSYSGLSYGSWTPSVSGFVGIRFARAGQDVFGWIRLHIEGEGSNATSLLIRDWAYESEPGVEIQAGEGLTPVPEPDGLALLATGAAGIAAWRRRRANERRHTP